MPDAQIDPEKVIQHLAQQLGQKAAELAITASALDQARARIAELDPDAAEKSAA